MVLGFGRSIQDVSDLVSQVQQLLAVFLTAGLLQQPIEEHEIEMSICHGTAITCGADGYLNLL